MHPLPAPLSAPFEAACLDLQAWVQLHMEAAAGGAVALAGGAEEERMLQASDGAQLVQKQS